MISDFVKKDLTAGTISDRLALIFLKGALRMHSNAIGYSYVVVVTMHVVNVDGFVGVCENIDCREE